MATKINTFAVSHLTKGAHCDFHNRVNNLITAIGATELHIEALAAQYAEALATELSIVNRETAFVATASMKEADKLRDSLLSCINAVVNAHQWNPLADKKTAYTYLAALIQPSDAITQFVTQLNGIVQVYDSIASQSGSSSSKKEEEEEETETV